MAALRCILQLRLYWYGGSWLEARENDKNGADTQLKGYTRRQNTRTRQLFDKHLLLFCAFTSLHNRFLSQSRDFHEFVPGPLEISGANCRQLGLLVADCMAPCTASSRDACRVYLLRRSKQTPPQSPAGPCRQICFFGCAR